MQDAFGVVLRTAIGALGLAILTGCAASAEAPPAAVESSATMLAISSPSPAAPAASPDPVPDPTAQETAVPGSHLDATGSITAFGPSSITVGGVEYVLSAATEIKIPIAVGTQVKLEYLIEPDGTRRLLEIKAP